MAYSAKAEALLALTDMSYDNWNFVMDQVRQKIEQWDFVGHKRLETFERVLVNELPENTARLATKRAILVAIGEMEEPKPTTPAPKAKKTRRQGKQKEHGNATQKVA